MAAPNTARVGVGGAKVTGAIFTAPMTATVPTDATTALGSEFVCIGYTSSDGISISESGTERPCSHLETVCRTTLSRRASSSWERPLLFRMCRKFSLSIV